MVKRMGPDELIGWAFAVAVSLVFVSCGGCAVVEVYRMAVEPVECQ